MIIFLYKWTPEQQIVICFEILPVSCLCTIFYIDVRACLSKLSEGIPRGHIEKNFC